MRLMVKRASWLNVVYVPDTEGIRCSGSKQWRGMYIIYSSSLESERTEDIFVKVSQCHGLFWGEFYGLAWDLRRECTTTLHYYSLA